MEKIKILHVIKTLELGGAETNLRNLMGCFNHERFEHHVAYSVGGEIEPFFKGNKKIVLYKYSERSHKNASFFSLVIILKLIFYMRRQRIDIVHTHIFNAHFWGVFAARLAGVKVVEHVHDFRYYDPTELKRRHGYFNQNRFIRLFKGLSDIVIVLTRQNRDFLITKKYYLPEQVRIVPNGIPQQGKMSFGRKEVTDKLQLPEDSFIVFTACRISKTKNIDLIIKIAKKVRESIPRAVFLIAGDGPILEDYRARVAKERLDKNVRFVGFYSCLEPLFRAADLFLLPSFLELHSIAILEAMSFDVPILISKDVGCNSDAITDGVNGILLDPFSEEGWAEAIIRLFEDEEWRRTLGSNGGDLCRRQFDIGVNAQRIEAIYGELFSARHKPCAGKGG